MSINITLTVKDDGSAKVEIKKCGRGICSKVVWLRDSKDSQGKPLHDELQLRPRRSSARPPRQREHRRVERNVVVLVLVAIVVVAALVIAAWRFGGPG